MSDRHVLVGSEHADAPIQGLLSRVAPPSNPTERVEVTVRLKPGHFETQARLVTNFALQNRLYPASASPAEKTIRLVGQVQDLEQAFGVRLHQRELPGGGTHRAHAGPLSVPVALATVVAGVFGLDDRPAAVPHIRRTGRTQAADSELWGRPAGTSQPYRPSGTFTAIQLADLYGFPSGDGAGETIALIELGGGFRATDIAAYFGSLGLPVPAVSAVSVDHGINQPGGDADAEVMLDIEVAASVAPAAKIVVYFAPNTDRGFMDAISAAVHDTHADPSIISISWGGPESGWTPAAMQAFNRIFIEAQQAGITVLVASGDNGSSDGVDDGKPHADFPASSPEVTACGGTNLTAFGLGTANQGISQEIVWNDPEGGATGGGYSGVFPEPDYQRVSGRHGKRRGLPDVAANADPRTGYIVRVNGSDEVVGGTSAVAPLGAGLIARLNQLLGRRVGSLNPILYQNPHVCRDITVGNNGAYKASKGWDPCTGLGSIDGAKLLAALKPKLV